ncbi:hypothetical protein ACK3YY_01140 [Aeromonas caviae]
MSSIKSNISFMVHHEVKTLIPVTKIKNTFMKASQVNGMVPVYAQTDITVKFGANYETEMKPYSKLSKALTSYEGFGSRENQGRSVRIALKDMMNKTEMDSSNAVFGIFKSNSKMVIAVLDHQIDPKCKHNEVHTMNYFILDIVLGDRLTITKHFANMKQNHSPYFKGMGLKMTHNISTDRQESRGKYDRAIMSKKIDITAEDRKNESEFVIKAAEAANHNADVANHNARVINNLIDALIAAGISIPEQPEFFYEPEEEPVYMGADEAAYREQMEMSK